MAPPAGWRRRNRAVGASLRTPRHRYVTGLAPGALRSARRRFYRAPDHLFSACTWATVGGVSLIVFALTHSSIAQEVSFAPVVQYPVLGSPFEVAVCDADGDKSPDILVSFNPVKGTRLGVLINDGAGGFRDLELIPGVTSGASITCCDIDGDGDNDIVALGTVSTFLLLNDGFGSFRVLQGPVTTQSPLVTDAAVCCDFDSDGDLDIAVATGFEDTPQLLELFVNKGNGRFGPGRTMEVADQFTELVSGVACVDLDGNGHDDVVAFANSSRSFTVMFNDGLGGLSPTSISGLANAKDVAFGELDGAPGLDAVVAHERFTFHPGRLRMLRNTGNGVLSEWLDFGHTIAAFPRAVAVGRLNTDTLDDVVVTDALNELAMILLPVPDGFEHVATLPVEHSVNKIVAVDLNGDGLDDLVVPGEGADVVSVLINTTGQ